jgi:hypothetical protein
MVLKFTKESNYFSGIQGAKRYLPYKTQKTIARPSLKALA